MIEKLALAEKLALFEERWSPRIIGGVGESVVSYSRAVSALQRPDRPCGRATAASSRAGAALH